MIDYRLAGQVLKLSCPVSETEAYLITGTEQEPSEPVISFPAQQLLCRTTGWVACENRQVEVWSAPPGMVVRVQGGDDLYISPGGEEIIRGDGANELTALDREVLLGPSLVLALALRGVWCLHASASVVGGRLTAFLGESGQGKSTLADFLNSTGSLQVADDILPVTTEQDGLIAWPHFPQLKLPADAQQGTKIPEQMPLHRVCLLSDIAEDQNPVLERLPVNQALQTLISHTAGTRLMESGLLANHLTFSTRAAQQVPVYRLAYPHRWDALEKVKELLENGN